MRFVGFAVFIIAVLWCGDMFFFSGQYTHEALVETNKIVQDFNYTVRRWARF